MEYEKSGLNRVKRGRKNSSYDQEVVYSILDDSEVCSVAFNVDGKAHVQPINFGRSGDKLYMHGSSKNRMTSALLDSGEVSLSVMTLDGMKLTRSAFKHSVNYRSVVVFGSVRELTTDEEKLEGLKAIVNHFVPGRWDYCRAPNRKELKATRVIEVEIQTASAKIDEYPPADEQEDYALGYWSGTIPVKTTYLPPVPDEKLRDGIEIPQHVLDFLESR
ncbi:pyridoxamine 5'-phosphate oxidase family protein [Solemya velum gill symbiont]|uniref:Flavin-nucleotide-binding protein n=1 Tax=Solemya velum gill symbiont TaxID=2340 RepID=A0A0B0HDI3_SOVGS|nr:pyridoxamine 5'-phosphate oxidase family protein [Solemya velum gill symbiont]KHF25501.1 flavin-nucleotide-binding protein [Solemya velum gill symbiont]OOY35333.1 hypothetical protein BOV88_05210 [Solemya velum gill symbiont]OOY38076.1 hypothetical protein BOV89_04340 [Solemya velum gill symbiont]OOY41059.1 hypothetical protein BOV90_00880 [Solemya velum gill symbiont]OOY44631.1 hypothetical protein BOV91_00825 [Solemya velum gill symbiont]